MFIQCISVMLLVVVAHASKYYQISTKDDGESKKLYQSEEEIPEDASPDLRPDLNKDGAEILINYLDLVEANSILYKINSNKIKEEAQVKKNKFNNSDKLANFDEDPKPDKILMEHHNVHLMNQPTKVADTRKRFKSIKTPRQRSKGLSSDSLDISNSKESKERYSETNTLPAKLKKNDGSNKRFQVINSEPPHHKNKNIEEYIQDSNSEDEEDYKSSEEINREKIKKTIKPKKLHHNFNKPLPEYESNESHEVGSKSESAESEEKRKSSEELQKKSTRYIQPINSNKNTKKLTNVYQSSESDEISSEEIKPKEYKNYIHSRKPKYKYQSIDSQSESDDKSAEEIKPKRFKKYSRPKNTNENSRRPVKKFKSSEAQSESEDTPEPGEKDKYQSSISGNDHGDNDDNEFYLQGNNLVRGRRTTDVPDEDNSDETVIDLRRQRLPYFLPKRYHWRPHDIGKLGYYWFNTGR